MAMAGLLWTSDGLDRARSHLPGKIGAISSAAAACALLPVKIALNFQLVVVRDDI